MLNVKFINLLIACTLLISLESKAGFVTGVVVGHAVTQKGNSTQQNPVGLYSSNTHDTIMCKSDGSNMCSMERVNGMDVSISPAQYAGKLGYKYLHKVSIILYSPSYIYITMEVSK